MEQQHHRHPDSSSNLRTAFFLNLGFTIIEIFGGFWTNSVAILSDALHDLGDSLSLGAAWYLDKKSKQGKTKKFTFGFKRFSLLGALINSVVLIAGSIFILYEAIQRIIDPISPNAKGMIFFAVAGIVVNGLAALRLKDGKTLNERVIMWHLLEDVLGWVAVLVVSIVLMFKDIPMLDALLSILITLYVLWNVMKRLKETMIIFLQGVPQDIDVSQVEAQFLDIPKVKSVHHTHIWSLNGEDHVLTTHIKLMYVEKLDEILEVKQKVREVLKQYPLAHWTIETELDKETCALENT